MLLGFDPCLLPGREGPILSCAFLDLSLGRTTPRRKPRLGRRAGVVLVCCQLSGVEGLRLVQILSAPETHLSKKMPLSLARIEFLKKNGHKVVDTTEAWGPGWWEGTFSYEQDHSDPMLGWFADQMDPLDSWFEAWIFAHHRDLERWGDFMKYHKG